MYGLVKIRAWRRVCPFLGRKARKRNDEHGPMPRQVGRFHRTTHRLGKRFDYRKAKPAIAAALEPHAALVCAIEAVEEMFGVFIAKAGPIVFDRDYRVIGIRRDFHAHASVFAGEATRVLYQVDENLIDGICVAVDVGRLSHNRERNAAEFYLEAQLNNVSNRLMEYNVIQVALIILTLLIMFHIYHDITNREMMLAVEKKAVEKSSKAKSTFFFNMSHDIRTPMNAIIGYTNIIKKEPGLSPKIADYLSKIEVSGNHLLDLINDVLEMSRIENGKLELQPTAVNLPQLFAEVRDLFATQMEAKGLQFTVSTEDVRHKTVLCDGKRLNRVLLNLISNAYKFTPEGGAVNVTLTEATQAPSSETDDGYTTTEKAAYEMRVKDSGMGMSKEFAAKVFEAYERDRAANNIQGTGLGTAITKSIIDLMGGTITVETELGKGSEFIINVALPITEDTASTPETTTNENASLDFSDIRILLVEDVEVNREIATLILSEFGFEMESAENGKNIKWRSLWKSKEMYTLNGSLSENIMDLLK